VSSFPLPGELGEHVVAYTTPWCGYCVAARRLLDKRHISFADIDVTGNQEARRWLAENSGQRTVPQIFIGGQSIGGFDELLAMDRSGELAAAMAG
jgi:glutaredoxin 3